MIDFDGTEDDAYRSIVELFEKHDADYANKMILHDLRNLMGHITGSIQVLHILNDDVAENAGHIMKTVNIMEPEARRILAILNAYFRYQIHSDEKDTSIK